MQRFEQLSDGVKADIMIYLADIGKDVDDIDEDDLKTFQGWTSAIDTVFIQDLGS